MGIVLSLLLIAVGAVLRFAVSYDVSGWNLQVTGVILMVVGVLGVILSLIFWSTWGGFGRRGSSDVYPEEERVVTREREIR